jgi:hypothetical protein
MGWLAGVTMIRLINISAAAIIFTSCNVYNHVTVGSAAGVKFENYHSYAWLKDIADSTGMPYYTSVVRNNIRNYIGKKLVAKGYDFDPQNPDLLLQVVIHHNRKNREIILSPKVAGSNYFFGSNYYSAYHHDSLYSKSNVYCYPEGYCTEKMEYLEGSITLNVIDRARNLLVWTGTAEGNVYDPENVKQHIHPAVRSLMKKYPFTKKGQ